MSAPTSYRDAYARLSRIAAELESGEADLDRVLPLLEEARAAYAECQSRIEAVRGVLSGGWGGQGAPEDSDDEPTGDNEDEVEETEEADER